MSLSAFLLVTALTATAVAAPINASPKDDTATRAACQALVHVRGMQFAATQTLSGEAVAFDALAAELGRMEAGGGIPAADLHALSSQARAMLARRTPVLQFHEARRRIYARVDDVQEAVDNVFSAEASGKLSAPRMAAVNRLSMLAQRIPRSAGSLIVAGRADPDAVFVLARDVKSFKELLKGLREGNPDFRLSASKSKDVLDALETLELRFAATATQVGAVLGDLKGLVEALELQAAVQSEARASDQTLAPLCFGNGRAR